VASVVLSEELGLHRRREEPTGEHPGVVTTCGGGLCNVADPVLEGVTDAFG
jgi:hypothetical protein